MFRAIFSRLTKPHLLEWVWKKFLSIFYNEQWIVLLSKSAKREAPDWSDFKQLLPPPDRDWADPFLWQHEGQCYVFIEEKLFSEPYGHITCLKVDPQLNIISREVVLKRPYHMSYPFLFNHNGQLYMLPETLGNQAIEVYRCVDFPYQWEFEKTLIKDIEAVDATLTEKDGRWWLFANIRSGRSTRDTLHLYYADSPLSENWIPHPKNPVVKDVYSARPAGRIMSHNDELIRPSQDCSVRYGYATNFNRIITLTETDFAEARQHTFTPQNRILGTHTWNELDGWVAIDATIRRRKF